ncbi:MAG: TIGR04141 family sporadically distributed protein [Pyrinomonadaceae bacterium]
MEEPSSRTLTIHLSKEKQRRNSVVRSIDGAIERPIPLGRGRQGRLFIKQPRANPPSWADLFKEHVDPRQFGDTSSPGAALVVPVKDRWMAVTFGQGRYLLNMEAFEDRFGLKVALNCIDERKIKSMDKDTFDAIARHTREQATSEANAGQFGFDVERDMLCAVTGSPKNDDYGKRLTGMDALNAHVRIRLGDLHDLLELYHNKFFEDSYRKSFPWVDQIAVVSDASLERELNKELIDMILRRQPEDPCWLAIPGIIDWSQVSGFRYSNVDRRPEFYDIHLRTFLEHLREPQNLSVQGMKTRRVFCIGDNDQILKSWSVFNCLYCQLDKDGYAYVLNAGKWYILEKDFVRQVDESFDKVAKYNGTFADYNDDNEGCYNARIAKESADQYCLMDRDLTYLGGPMEFCDIFSKNKELIHIKRYGGSATLSHLFYQGVVSAEFFKMEDRYRKLVHDKLSRPFRVFDPAKRPAFEEYHVVFGIISRSQGKLTMPFFSRVGIRHAVRRLQGLDYKVSLAKIAVAETRSKRSKVRPVTLRGR